MMNIITFFQLNINIQLNIYIYTNIDCFIFYSTKDLPLYLFLHNSQSTIDNFQINSPECFLNCVTTFVEKAKQQRVSNDQKIINHRQFFHPQHNHPLKLLRTRMSFIFEMTIFIFSFWFKVFLISKHSHYSKRI